MNQNDLLSRLETGEFQPRPALREALRCTGAELDAALADLERLGYAIAQTKDGAQLLPVPGSLLPGCIRLGLETARMGRGEILYAPEMSSTNLVLREAARTRALPEGSLAVCDRQTAGRGRLQRTWDDSEPGASLPSTLLLTPKLPPERVQLVTLAAAVAAADAIADFGLEPGIKWPNDVVLSGRKCVGILCELVTGWGDIRQVIAGVGFNVNQQAFPEALAAKATSLHLELGHPVDRAALLRRYLLHMERAMDTLTAEGLPGLMPDYARRSVTLGRRVEVVGAAETFVAVAERIDETGALWVRNGQGEARRVLSGDVSVRGVMGYV